MNYLMIDTAEGTRGLLKIGNEYYYDENLSRSGSETLMPLIDGLIKRSGKKLCDIDAFGACIGPGSFTGLRIGLTTVKALCYALGKKCFGVNNLRLNSYNNDSDKVVSVADAGNRVCYIACFDGDREVLPTQCVTVADAKRIIDEHKDFALTTDVKLSAVLGGKSGVGERELRTAAEKHISDLVEQTALVPLYVRKAQPERGEGDL